MTEQVTYEARGFTEQAYDDWFADIYDAWYGDLFDRKKGPYRPVRKLFDLFPELAGKKSSEVRILDCACGTGNNYVEFSKDGYDIWATDGSAKMLERAQVNCKNFGISDERLIAKPISWTDTGAYQKYFTDESLSFDVVMLTSNSFCHLPSVPGYMDVALNNFRGLLRPQGRLLIDTKRYKKERTDQGVRMFRELRYENGKWDVRKTRDNEVQIEGLDVSIHTMLHYDIDPVFKIGRALIVVTIYGQHTMPRVHVLPYYPLPAERLESELRSSGFRSKRFPAKKPPLNWSYDFLVAQKQN